jgi:hypothetical protein
VCSSLSLSLSESCSQVALDRMTETFAETGSFLTEEEDVIDITDTIVRVKYSQAEHEYFSQFSIDQA